jgi:hypothetical protein
MSNKINFSSDNAKALVYVGLGIAVIIIMAFVVKKMFGGLDGLLESFGLKDDEAESKAKEDIEAAITAANANPTLSPWNPNFFKNAPEGARLKTVAATDKAAKQIYNSSGSILPDRPEEAFAGIKQMPTQAAISFLVERFEVLYQTDLLAWMNEAFNDTPTQKKTLAQILNYVQNLPKY